jgi:hypothetical protein
MYTLGNVLLSLSIKIYFPDWQNFFLSIQIFVAMKGTLLLVVLLLSVTLHVQGIINYYENGIYYHHHNFAFINILQAIM